MFYIPLVVVLIVMFSTVPRFVGNTNTNKTCFILLTIYIVIHVSGCVGRGPSALLCPGDYDAVKSVLVRLVYDLNLPPPPCDCEDLYCFLFSGVLPFILNFIPYII